MTFELEIAADKLRRADPTSWMAFLEALGVEKMRAYDRMVGAPASDLHTCQGEARAYNALLARLIHAPQAAQRIAEGRE